MSYRNKISLENKNAVVIGGAGLIGSEVSQALAEFGANITVLDIDSNRIKNLQNSLKNKGYAIRTEFIDLSEVETLDGEFSKILNSMNEIDVFVNCSYPRPKKIEAKSFSKISYEYFGDQVAIHMNSFCWMAKMVADKMLSDRTNGSIIQIASIYGVVGQNLSIYEGTGMEENAAYAAIKGGIINFTRQMASYYGKYNIRINTVSPGGIFDNQDEEFVRNYINQTPLKRMGRPEDIASTILFLSSQLASYVTGENILVDGGWTKI